MESLVTRVNLLLGLLSIVSAGGLHLDFGVNLPPFVLHMPRFNLPPIKLAATFKPSTGSSPFAIKFPGISISTNQGQQDSWWNQNQAWPEPEPEVEPYPESEPEPEPEPESEPEPEPEYYNHHHHSHHSYDPWGKSSIKSFHHKDSWASRARMVENGNNNNKVAPQHVYMKQQSTNAKSSVLTHTQHLNRQKSIVNAHMSAIRGSSSSPSPAPSSSVIDKSPPTKAEVDSWLNQMKSINTISDQYDLSSSPIDYDRRSSNAHITKPYSPPINPKLAKIEQTSSPTATIKISNENNLLKPANRVNHQQSNNH